MVPVYIIGRFNAAEIAPAGMGTVDLRCGGLRVVDNGPYEIGSVPKLQDLLMHEDIVITLLDRQSDKEIMTVTAVRPTGWDTNMASRSLQDLNVSFMGTTFADESGAQEDTGAVNFG
jgi:hypothetical protein